MYQVDIRDWTGHALFLIFCGDVQGTNANLPPVLCGMVLSKQTVMRKHLPYIDYIGVNKAQSLHQEHSYYIAQKKLAIFQTTKCQRYTFKSHIPIEYFIIIM